MAKQTALYLHAGHNSLTVNFTSADTTVAKKIFGAGANDSDLKIISATSDDTAAINLRLYTRRGGVSYPIGCVRIPTLSGTDGAAPAKNLLNTVDIPGLALDPVLKPYLPVMAGDEIWAAPLATMTAAKTCSVTCIGHDY